MRYFDYNATTPVAPEVFDAMVPFLRESWGNPSSVYAFGHRVVDAIERAREQVAQLIGAQPGEVVFTSCGTESSNTALISAVLQDRGPRHCLMPTVEHAANLETAKRLEQCGAEVEWIGVGSDGRVSVDSLSASFRSETALVSVMWANNETGVISPIAELGSRCRDRGVRFHSDAVQAAGKVPIDVTSCPVDYLSLSGHKLYAPKGIGALFVREGAPFHSLIVGGGQEKGRRAGTQNVAFIVALGRAAELAGDMLEAETLRLTVMRDRLEGSLLELPGVRVNGGGAPRLPNTSNLAFEGVESEALLLLLEREGICASSGSACSTGSLEPSHVLVGMGLDRLTALSSIRLSLGRMTKEEDVDHLISVMPRLISRLRGAIP